jgi:hypothetical protein
VSGGSYNYLCFGDVLGDHRGDLAAMADRLAELAPGSRAYRHTRAILDAVNAVTEALRDVWHDVEWADSGDYGPEDAVSAIERYERAVPDPSGAAGERSDS